MDAEEDVAVRGWAGLTVRVAWTLATRRVQIRPQVLRDARDHVLYHLPPGLTLPQAEDRAEWLTRGFVARARRQPLNDRWPQDWSMPLPPRWRNALLQSLDPLSAAIFRLHYRDGRRLEELEQRLRVDRIALEAARAGLREVIRQAAAADGVVLDQWPHDRIDGLLRRLGAWSDDACPPLDDVLDGHHPEHLRTCARCERCYRLVVDNRIGREDLIPPAGLVRPEGRVDLIAIGFHPDARASRAMIARELVIPSVPVGDDMLLVDASEHAVVERVLTMAAEVNAPSRDHLRGVRLEGPGRWSQHGLLGPLADEAAQELRSRPWGTVESVGDLPPPLPRPPSAWRWWAAVVAVGVVAAWAWSGVLRLGADDADHPLEVEFVEARGGVWTWFDVDDEALVYLVRRDGAKLDVILESAEAADKVVYATGDGAFRLHTSGAGVLLVSASHPLTGLDGALAQASGSEHPFEALADWIETSQPGADVRWFPR